MFNALRDECCIRITHAFVCSVEGSAIYASELPRLNLALWDGAYLIVNLSVVQDPTETDDVNTAQH